MESRADRPRRAWIAAGLVLAIAIAVAVAAGTAAVAFRRPLLRWAILTWASAQGLEPVDLEVERVSLKGVLLRRVQVGSVPDLHIEEAEARLGLRELLRGRLLGLRVSGLQLRARLGEEGVSLGAVDPFFAGDGGDALPLLAAAEITLEQARGQIETPYGRIDVEADGEIREATPGRLDGRFEGRAHHAAGSARAGIVLSGPLEDLVAELWVEPELVEGAVAGLGAVGGFRAQGRVHRTERGIQGELQVPSFPLEFTAADVTARATIPALAGQLVWDPEREAATGSLDAVGGTLQLDALGIAVDGIGARVRLEDGPPVAELRVDSIADSTQPTRFAPLAALAELTLQEAEITGHARLFRAGADPDGDDGLRVAATGRLDPTRGHGQIEAVLAPVRLADKGSRPADLSPLAREWIGAAGGEVEGKLAVELADWRPRLRTDLVLRDVSAESEVASLSGVNGHLVFEGPPFRSEPGQLVSIALIDVGVPLVQGLLEFEWTERGLLLLQRAEWQWAGGSLSTRAELDPGSERQDATLRVSELDVAQVLQAVELEGLSGTGRLSGRIPLQRRGDRVEIADGVLRAKAPGVLRYAPGAGVEASARKAEGMGTLLRALEDFRYDKLELRLDGDTRGVMRVGVQLHGANPAFDRGRRVEFNLNLEAHLSDLIRSGQAGSKIPAVIQKQLEKYSAGLKGGP